MKETSIFVTSVLPPLPPLPLCFRLFTFKTMHLYKRIISFISLEIPIISYPRKKGLIYLGTIINPDRRTIWKTFLSFAPQLSSRERTRVSRKDYRLGSTER
jgi:hypothetical protein